MKKVSCVLLAVLLVFVMVAATACSIDVPDGNGGNPPAPPQGGGPGGGSVAELPSETDESYLSTVSAGTIDFTQLSADTDLGQDIAVFPNSQNTISADGSYLLSGSYLDGISIAKGLTVHLYLNGVDISKVGGVALETGKKCNVTLTVVKDTENTISTNGSDEYNAIHVKGSLAINGSGILSVVSYGKNAVKVSKDLRLVDATLQLNGANHAIACGSFAAYNANIVAIAVKDGINADCDFDNSDGKTDYQFVTDEGFVSLVNCNYTANVGGDGIQAETFVFLKNGKVDIATVGTFVPYTQQNMELYGLEADDFRYIKSGETYKKIASDYFGGGTKYAFTTSCKGIKVGVVEYEVTTETVNENGQTEKTTVEYSVEKGDYCLVIDGTEMEICSYDDALHVNNGNAFVLSGNILLTTLDDGLTADGLVRISGGTLSVTSSYEGIEGAYVEIVGGNVDVTSSDDGINAASDDESVVEHIIISGGNVTVNAQGDGLDSNGTILVSGGSVVVQGPTSGGDGGLDADSGILVNGGTLFVVSSNGMVETPATNSLQCVISYAQSSTIAAGTEIKLVDSDGNTVVSATTAKTSQSVIVSSGNITVGNTYTLYVGTATTQITVTGIVTTAGIASQGGHGGGGFGPGGGGFGGRN